MKTPENLRGFRYADMFLLAGDALTKTGARFW